MSAFRRIAVALWRALLSTVAHTVLPTTDGWRRPLVFANALGRGLIVVRERLAAAGLARPGFEIVHLDEPPAEPLADNVRRVHDAAQAASTTALSAVWEEAARRFREGLSDAGLRAFRRSAVGDSGYMASGLSTNRRQALDVVLAYHRFAGLSNPLLVSSVEETPVGSLSAVRYRGKLISYNLMRHAMFAGRLERHVDFTQPLTIVEIGSGYGGLARMIKRLSPRSRIILVDIPSSLSLAYYYLTRTCPGSRIAPPDMFRNGADALASNADFVLMPDGWIHDIPAESVDLVINTTSFQEMEESVLRFYFGELQRFARGHFYCYNRLQTPPSYGGVSFRDYPFDDRWQPVSLSMSPEGHLEWLGKRTASL